ncbi:response regulator [Leptospira interrogans serovar Szwajizak]|uniref:response regulator n=1 Tax=Leptospira interrogans TaxID=173 RepID=UPI0002BC2D1C|nr:response regulator [Leptospira interrogans]AKP27547.1 response regulator [Leptospira interrogans serovar Manilae]AKP31319.1 response regulator [Leptospira interrogans serovar Manilae]EMJ54529.1 response regulator receiver domain protein [Leptospira interrogans serovar Valbuzzi str. Duyster]ENO72637.1 response regulator receiver domain protein [Leptospira interrogans serovar Valbuzzi str. Valbuzzi]EYU64074.1 response regulator [Leptospira interrogans serovar Manilae]
MRNKKSNLILISSNQKIIIVDDNQKYAQQLSSLLLSKKETIQISCAENIRSGYKKILKGNFEVFFCDITIRKRLVGFYLVHRLRKRNDRIKIILMSTIFDYRIFFILFYRIIKFSFALNGICKKSDVINGKLVIY